MLLPQHLQVWTGLCAAWPLAEGATGLAPLRAALEAGGDPDCAGAAGWTPLGLCAMGGRSDACQMLIDAKADVFAAAGPRGRTALLWADWYQASDSLAVLTSHGRKMKKEDREGLKRFRAASKDDLVTAILAPIDAAKLRCLGKLAVADDFRGLCAGLWERMQEAWVPSPSPPGSAPFQDIWEP